MSCSLDAEGPAIMQLHKWDSTLIQLNLSEFREGFISPRKDHILLLSSQCEAMMFPLIIGDSKPCNEDRKVQNLRLELEDDMPCTSGSVTDNDSFVERKISRFNDYPFVSDVNSLAWGVCGDNYNQHKDVAFRELLFLCGDRGVTVHAFFEPNKSSELTDPTVDAQFEHGIWVEWGPTSRVHKMDEDEENFNSKRWLKTFMTKVETVEYDGDIYTKFPDKQSFPRSAKVVSFSIFDNNSLFFNFDSHATTLSSTENTCKEETGMNLMSDSHVLSDSSSSRVKIKPDALSNFMDIGMDDPYKCFKVFSSNSHHLIGFAMKTGDPVNYNNEANGRILSKFLIVVARLDGMGIQWLCSKKLEGSMDTNLEFDWADFQLSDNFLLCLNAFGSIFIYSALTGEDVGHLDILQVCGLSPLPKKVFRKLIISSGTIHLAAVDEYGVVYLIYACDHLQEKHYSLEKFLPNYQHSGPRIVGWEIGGFDICHQRYFSDISDSCLIDGSVRYNTLKRSNNNLQKIFLPTERFSEDDFICCSPFGITRLVKKQKRFQIFHSPLHLNFVVRDDLYSSSHQGTESFCVGEQAVSCAFEGCFYLVTQSGLSVVLPSVSTSSDFFPIESIGYRQPRVSAGINHACGVVFEMEKTKQAWSPWKVEVLDNILLYEGTEEADRLCMENCWDIKVSRIRRLQLALDYLKFDDIEQSLEMLVDIDLVEEGILRLLLAAAYLMFCKVGNESEVSSISRLLALASCFTIRIIRKYGLLQRKENALTIQRINGSRIILSSVLPYKDKNGMDTSQRLLDMTHFLEIIRNLQSWFVLKFKRPGQELVDGGKTSSMVDSNLTHDDLTVPSADAMTLETQNQNMLALPTSDLGFKNTEEKLALMPIESSDKSQIDTKFIKIKVRPLENPKDMIARWEIDNMDIKTIVREALNSGRLPLAVLQLHRHRLKEFNSDKEPPDTFSEVRIAGRAITYELFLKGETALAVATLQKLGEDIEYSLKQLMFGTVRKSLRMQVAEEMTRYGYLGPFEWKLLERISLVEGVYPSSSFWKTFNARHKELKGVSSNSNYSTGDIKLSMLKNVSIDCGEVDGVVLGSWVDIDSNCDVSAADDNNSDGGGYWVAAAIWSDAWDERTIDRIMLDRPSVLSVPLPWDSQLEYHICHNNWKEVSKLLDTIPTYLLSDGSLQISLDGLQSSSHDYLISSVEELDAVLMAMPKIKLFNFSVNNNISLWLKTLMEQKLATKFIFMKEYWDGTAEIIPILASAGFITKSILDEFEEDTVEAVHKLVVQYSAQYNLPIFLGLFLDNNMLNLDGDSLCSLLKAAEDCQWVKWLLLSKIKGREYEASFSNARTIMSHNSNKEGHNLSDLDLDETIFTVDDIAEGGGEMAALATLMYAPILFQNCISSGSVSRHKKSSAQCTLENLKPILQKFPTFWRTLVASCFGQDITCNFSGPKPKHVDGNPALSNFLKWRDIIFFSTGRDTSLLQMLPCWFPKSIRRLVQLYMEGPDIDVIINAYEGADVSAVSWEAAIQKLVEEKFYDSSLKVSELGIEHHLHRGRPLAAFNHLLDVRVQKLKSEKVSKGQTNVQSDVQTLLAPLAQNEVTLLSSVIPLAIKHFEDSILVASCAFLLDLCGLSANMLRVDITALRRISTFYKSTEYNDRYNPSMPMGSTFHTVPPKDDIADSLAQALADDYLHRDDDAKSVNGKPPSKAVRLVLEHLEKASLPSKKAEEKTCGSWLLNDIGDGTELRSQQKATSQHWNLLTIFCQMHDMPLSTKYLDVLARDNDWVGFLSEAQIGGYPFDVVFQVASKEFSDPALKNHILTVLKGMQSKKKNASSHSETSNKQNETPFLDEKLFIPVELFGILAECEKQKNPGESLLVKAKDMCWSILALIASCFPDVSSLSCLTVWLEITAARETSSIKVNDISSQITKNVGAAVEVTNLLPASSKANTFHYNRRSPKRRRLMDPVVSMEPLSSNAGSGTMLSAQETGSELDEEKSTDEGSKHIGNLPEGTDSLSKMVAVLCEQHLFLPLLRAFEIFLPSCSILPFIRALQAYSQMRLSEASAHLGSFSYRIKEEPIHLQTNIGRDEQIGMSWISSTAIKAADAMLSTCPSPYEKRCLLKLLSATDFGDGGSASAYYRRLFWKITLAEPALWKDKDNGLYLGTETLDDASLLLEMEKNGHWEQARKWARQLETGVGSWKSAVHHVTETQAESMVAEWKEFLWDVPEERVALWGHCQMLFLRHSFPALQAGIFFLKHAEAVEKDLPAKELHDLLLLSLQWLSGTLTQCSPVYPLHLLREIETRVWLLAVESEAQSGGDFTTTVNSWRDPVIGNSIPNNNIIDRTASVITKMDSHINGTRMKNVEKNDTRETNQTHLNKNPNVVDTGYFSTKTKRRAKGYLPSRRILADSVEKTTESEDHLSTSFIRNDLQPQDENVKIELSFSRWEERVGPDELERAVLSLLEFGQITAAKQLHNKLSPTNIPSEFKLVDAALKLASLSTSCDEVSISMLDEDVKSVMKTYQIPIDQPVVYPSQVLENLVTSFIEGSGRGLCKRIIAVLKAAKLLGLSFLEAFEKQPIEILQLLSLKAQESFEEAKLLVGTHSMSATSIAQILAESFLKGLLAAHRGGYMDTQKEEGPAPLLWRFSDFMKWAKICPSEPEVGHALMRLVITGQEIPHACEVELLILSHHFYKSSACLDGVDVLVALAATRVEAYVSEGDFPCVARLITGVGNFYSLKFILDILIENGQLDVLLQKYSAAADTNTGAAENVQGFRMAVLTSLKHFNPNDLDALAMVYNHFDMKHETATLLESRGSESSKQWFLRYDKDQNEDLLQSMRYYIEAAEVHSSIDAGNKTRKACAQASLVSLQIRMPDYQYLHLTDTNARCVLVAQSCFQEALIVAEAYGLNQPSEWALVLWNQMLNPELTEVYVAEFVAVLPFQPSMLADLLKFYRAEMAARGDQSHFAMWFAGGGMPADWAKYLGRSFRSLLKRTRDLRLRLQLAATLATGFSDVIDACSKAMDKVPDNVGPLVLRKGHGGAYLPLM